MENFQGGNINNDNFKTNHPETKFFHLYQLTMTQHEIFVYAGGTVIKSVALYLFKIKISEERMGYF